MVLVFSPANTNFVPSEAQLLGLVGLEHVTDQDELWPQHLLLLLRRQ